MSELPVSNVLSLPMLLYSSDTLFDMKLLRQLNAEQYVLPPPPSPLPPLPLFSHIASFPSRIPG